MSDLPENLRSVDWRLTTFEGVRREQLRRWAELPLDRIIAGLEEMGKLSAGWQSPGDAAAKHDGGKVSEGVTGRAGGEKPTSAYDTRRSA